LTQRGGSPWQRKDSLTRGHPVVSMSDTFDG
jgi:hypothetical protein